MPHLIIEHSPELSTEQDMQGLCNQLFDVLAVHPEIMHPSSLKIRTIPVENWRIGTDPQSFVHITFLLLSGRSDAAKSDLTKCILDVLCKYLPEVGSLSVNLGELDAAYTKRVL